MTTPTRRLRLDVAIIAGTLLATLVGAQVWQANTVVDALNTSEHGPNAQEAEFLNRPDLVDLFRQPMFSTPAWQDYQDALEAEQNGFSADGIAKTERILDANVWLPGLNQFYTAEAVRLVQAHQPDTTQRSQMGAASVFLYSCSNHNIGDSRETIIAEQEQSNPKLTFVADIVDYSLAHCEPLKN